MTATILALRQRVRSTSPKDAQQPHGFIFAFRGETKARVVFDDSSIRDVELKELEPGYVFEPYDVIQIRRHGGGWADLSTLRTDDDVERALSMVASGKWNGEQHEFRIIRNVPGEGAVVVHDRPAAPTCFYCRQPIGDAPKFTIRASKGTEYCHRSCAERD